MDISVNEQNQERIRRKVASGKYSTSNEVIAKALELLDQSDAALTGELAEVRAKVQEGIDQLARGDYVECTDETLDALLEEIESEALEDLEAHQSRAE